MQDVYNTFDLNPKFTKDQCPHTHDEQLAMAEIPYRKAIESLMWTAVATRPDIAFTASLLSQFPKTQENYIGKL